MRNILLFTTPLSKIPHTTKPLFDKLPENSWRGRLQDIFTFKTTRNSGRRTNKVLRWHSLGFRKCSKQAPGVECLISIPIHGPIKIEQLCGEVLLLAGGGRLLEMHHKGLNSLGNKEMGMSMTNTTRCMHPRILLCKTEGSGQQRCNRHLLQSRRTTKFSMAHCCGLWIRSSFKNKRGSVGIPWRQSQRKGD